jgi:hypothetical protein
MNEKEKELAERYMEQFGGKIDEVFGWVYERIILSGSKEMPHRAMLGFLNRHLVDLSAFISDRLNKTDAEVRFVPFKPPSREEKDQAIFERYLVQFSERINEFVRQIFFEIKADPDMGEMLKFFALHLKKARLAIVTAANGDLGLLSGRAQVRFERSGR